MSRPVSALLKDLCNRLVTRMHMPLLVERSDEGPAQGGGDVRVREEVSRDDDPDEARGRKVSLYRAMERVGTKGRGG
jgi:hypothetical protein